jgi:hypothetical protein
VEYIVDFFGVALVQPAGNASVLCELGAALEAGLRGRLHFLADEALNLLYFFKLHAFDLAALLELEDIVVAQLAGVEYFAAGRLHVAWVRGCLHLRW